MRLRFTIRDLLWLTLVTVVLVAWWLDRSRQANKIDALLHPHPNYMEKPIFYPAGPEFKLMNENDQNGPGK